MYLLIVSKVSHLYSATHFDVIESPIGKLHLLVSEESLHAVLYKNYISARELKPLKRAPRHPIVLKTKKQLKEYFAGHRKEFDLPLYVEGTSFQKKAWRKLQTIPYGATISYQEQARRLGDIKKSRAVGTANSKNPHSIIVPCHRVIAKSGKLSGYGGGVSIKKFLLEHEFSQMER